jgi:hypothetical protein
MQCYRKKESELLILALCFSPRNTRLVAVSPNWTVHLFAPELQNVLEQDAPRAIAKIKIRKAKEMEATRVSERELVVK